jgi:hypothetical protein
LGEPHERQRALSSLHSNFEPDSVEVKEKLAADSLVLAGGSPVMVVSGEVVSQARRHHLVDARRCEPMRSRCRFVFDVVIADRSVLGANTVDRAAAQPAQSAHSMQATRMTTGNLGFAGRFG